MKKINLFINESITYCPHSKRELEKLVLKLIKERGLNANLNDIDTSNIKSMSYLFSKYDDQNKQRNEYFWKFNGDISNWDVSNVKNMEDMFRASEFDGDISKWNVSKVEYMTGMFAYSKFDNDISKWDVKNVKVMLHMFTGSKFNKNIDNWEVNEMTNIQGIFDESPNLLKHKPKWYKNN